MKRGMKRAQMEAMGLAIIVILLFLGMLFVVRFVFLKPVSDYKEDYTRTQLASNMISTLLETNAAECMGLSFKDLFIDCATIKTINCEGVSSCNFARDKTAFIFDNTLGEWKKSYEFNAFLVEDDPVINIGSCARSDDITSKTFPVPTAVGGATLYLKLDICVL